MRAGALLLAVLPLLAGDASALAVRLIEPAGDTAVFGEVAFEAQVSPDTGARVTFYLDGRKVGERASPPFRLVVDVGEDNREHTFRVVARAGGQTAEATVVTPAIKVDADYSFELQQVYVTATADSRRVGDLAREEFTVRDNGHEQQITTFARGDVPLTAVVLLDSSSSMAGDHISAAREGARAFLSGLRTLDEARVVVFSDRTLLATPFAGPGADHLTPLASVRATGGTALADHLWAGLRLLDRRQGRRVIVLLSDGVDTDSALEPAAVSEAGRRSQAIVYWLRLATEQEGMTRTVSAWHDADWHDTSARALAEVVRVSGGRTIDIKAAETIPAAFAEIMAELREQYVLAYYPSSQKNDGRWHTVEVSVGRRGVEVRTRGGYVDF